MEAESLNEIIQGKSETPVEQEQEPVENSNNPPKQKRKISDRQRLALEKNRAVRKGIYEKKNQDSAKLKQLEDAGYSIDALLNPPKAPPKKAKAKAPKKKVKIISPVSASSSDEEIYYEDKKGQSVQKHQQGQQPFDYNYYDYQW